MSAPPSHAAMDAAWSKVYDRYYDAFLHLARQKSGRTEGCLRAHPERLARFRAAVRLTTGLFNVAETDDECSHALFQMREILELALIKERGIA